MFVIYSAVTVEGGRGRGAGWGWAVWLSHLPLSHGVIREVSCLLQRQDP